MKLTPKGKIITGYKATDVEMKCRGFQFKLGKWYEHEEHLELCSSGFHFCKYPSGPWSYYDSGRIFVVEAEYVLLSDAPGADLKYVARKIKLVSEINITGHKNTGDKNTGTENTGHRNAGDRNTGHRNTGDRNTGDRNAGDKNTGHRNTGTENAGDKNTGHRNTGNRNAGDWNAGDWNTGHRNTGHRNTGDGNTGNRNTGHRNTGDGNTGNRNTGNRNTGDWNTGHRNTGHRNTGDGNTGYWNTGDWNTGDGNACNYSSGFFNVEDKIIMFDTQISINRNKLDFKLIKALTEKLLGDHPFDCSKFLLLPNATEEKIKTLHKKHIERRK